MFGKGIVVALLLVLLVLGLASFAFLPAQPGAGFAGFQPPPPPVGRYTVVKTFEAGGGMFILLLDTATGDLYRANADDAKPYKERPKMGPPTNPDPLFRDKDRPFRDKADKDFSPFKDARDLPKDFPFKDKGRVKDEDFRKDGFKDKGFEKKDGFRKDDIKDSK